MKLVLHLGLESNESLLIQSFLIRNKDYLTSAGIYFSMDMRDGRNSSFDGIGNKKLIGLKNTSNVKSIMERLQERLNEVKAKWFIWNSNSIFFSDKEEIKALKESLEFDEIDIVIILMRQEMWLESAYYQNCWKVKSKKGNSVIDFDEFYKAWLHKADYYKYVKNWAEVFGQNKIKILINDNDQTYTQLISAFLETIKLAIPDLEINDKHNFSNLGHYEYQVLAICNLMSEFKLSQNGLIELLHNNVERNRIVRSKKGQSLISPQDASDIIVRFDESNQMLAQEYLKSESGILFKQALPDLKSKWKPFDEMSLEHFIPIMFDILIHQEKRIKLLERKSKKMIQKIKSINKENNNRNS